MVSAFRQINNNGGGLRQQQPTGGLTAKVNWLGLASTCHCSTSHQSSELLSDVLMMTAP